jgi:hypothetical protein
LFSFLGELELENVPLKKNIFRNWGLPVEVKSGVVGRIKIEFNILKYFRNEPVLITIEDVCLVAGPIILAEVELFNYVCWNLKFQLIKLFVYVHNSWTQWKKKG